MEKDLDVKPKELLEAQSKHAVISMLTLLYLRIRFENPDSNTVCVRRA